MPYIKKEDRVKYQGPIEEILKLIPSEKSAIEQANTLAYFADCVIQALRMVSNPQFEWIRHFTMGSGLEAKCREEATKLARMLPANVDARAGELNYFLSSICWGLAGDAPGRDIGRYCQRSFIKGALWRALLVNLFSFNGEDSIFFLGVFTDVIDETYRRKTADYEDKKIVECGDLWL